MSKAKILLYVVAVTLLALTAAVTFAVVARNADASGSNATKTIHLTFAGLVTTGQTKDTPITGGLTEVVRASGYFNGNLHLDDGTQISTSGKFAGNTLSITFYSVTGSRAVQGTGRMTKAGDYVGTFNEYYEGAVTGTGTWSALPIRTTSQVRAFTFAGIDMDGYDSNAIYTGTLVLDKKTLKGTCNLTNGLVISVNGSLDHQHKFTLHFHLAPGRKIIGTGTLSQVDDLNGFAGTFVGPVQNDTGNWVTYSFKF